MKLEEAVKAANGKDGLSIKLDGLKIVVSDGKWQKSTKFTEEWLSDILLPGEELVDSFIERFKRSRTQAEEAEHE